MCSAPWGSIAKNKKAAQPARLADGRSLKRHRLRAFLGVRIEPRRWIEVACMASAVLRAIGPEVNRPQPSTPDPD